MCDEDSYTFYFFSIQIQPDDMSCFTEDLSIMESLSLALQPYRESIGQIASIVTIAQFFAGTLVCKEIYEKKSTKGVNPTPFIGGIAIGILTLKLAFIMNDAAMFQVNVAAIILNTCYTLFYYNYAGDKYEEVLKPVGMAGGLTAVFLGYANWEDPSNVEFRYGLLLTMLMLLLLAAPLAELKTILDNEDASSIPFPLTFMATCVTFLWLLYGLAINNLFMVVQNVAGFLICALQLWLIYTYPGHRSDIKPKKKKQQ
ncbi:unnamed protein product [Phyllotreta striolata]|uniref:Sugar transporter SWEET n=1 Tax=Phyllotreta striolata TaxID=444603 RepID=A0A9N9XJN9_PHYSR|nr:unnamed protein product [Phyllotreta striolata]